MCGLSMLQSQVQMDTRDGQGILHYWAILSSFSHLSNLLELICNNQKLSFMPFYTVAVELCPYVYPPSVHSVSIFFKWWQSGKGGIGWTLKVYIWQELSVSTMLDTGSSCWEIALLLQPIMTSPRAFTGQSELGFRAIGESALNSAGWKRLSVPAGIWYGHQLAAGT